MGAHELEIEHHNALVKVLTDSLAFQGLCQAADTDLFGSADTISELLLEAGWRPAYDGTVEVVEDSAGEFRWRLVATNAQPVAGPQEGYVDREHAELMASKITGIYPS